MTVHNGKNVKDWTIRSHSSKIEEGSETKWRWVNNYIIYLRYSPAYLEINKIDRWCSGYLFNRKSSNYLKIE